MSAVKVTISLAEKLLEKIDTTRGLIPRSTYIADILEKKHDGEGK